MRFFLFPAFNYYKGKNKRFKNLNFDTQKTYKTKKAQKNSVPFYSKNNFYK